jgi:hypothetical protein
LEFNKILPIFFGIAIVAALIFGMAFFSNQKALTGLVSLDLNSHYKEGHPLDGTLNLSLREGELLPAAAKVTIENGNETFEYPLGELLSDDVKSGEFYVEGKSLSGSGQGYGIEGTKESNPIVYFTLQVSSSETENETQAAEETAPTQTEITTQPQSEQVIEEQQASLNSQSTTAESSAPEAATENAQTQAEEASAPAESSNPTETAPITGNAILDISRGIFASFLRLMGLVSADLTSTVDGQASRGDDFSYTLGEGQTASIVPGSVRMDKGSVADNLVSLSVAGSQATVSTEYFETESGFGREYLGTGEKALSIDLSKLGLVPERGNLKISIMHEGEEIVSLTASLAEEGNISAANATDIPNETIANKTAEVPENISLSRPSLSDSERRVLIGEFGNSSLEITKAEKTDSFYLVRFELGQFWTERTYPGGYSQSELEERVKEDMTLFLKDLARKFSQEEQQKEEIGGLTGSYGI